LQFIIAWKIISHLFTPFSIVAGAQRGREIGLLKPSNNG